MKAQKLGLVLGINIAAACLVLQGCKAKQGGKAVQPSPTDNRVTVISRPSAPAPRPAPAVVAPAPEPQALPAQPIQPEPVVTVTPAPAMQEPPPPAPSAVRTVKKLPTAPAKAPKAKPAAAPAKAAATPADAAPVEYVVKPGDTLFLISKRTNYRQSAIVAANPGLNPNRLRVGQKLNLPGAVAVAKAPVLAAKDAPKDDAAKDKVKPAAAPAAAAANTVAPIKTKGGFVPYEGPTKDYVVKSGDSVGQIAVSSGISIRALKALNGLKGDALRAGQKLKVPAEKQTAPKAVAAAKDAPAKDVPAKPAVVAKADDAKAAPAPEVKEAAAPTPAAAEAKPAEPVKAVEPAKAEEAAKVEEATPPAEAPAAPAQATHTVKEGEDLVSIAIAYGISPSALMDINDLKPTDEVKPGQILKLPANAKQ